MAKRKVITGEPMRSSMKRPFVPNAKDTSADAQTMIQEPPAPFKNDMTAAQAPTPSSMQQNNMRGNPPGQAAVGQNRPINQKGQVFGPKGVSHPSTVGAYPSVPGSHGSSMNVSRQKSIGGNVRLTDPMAGQHGTRVGTKHKRFYGES